MGNRIDLANAILKMKKIKAEPKVNYSLVKYKKKGYYDILKEIRNHITLVQLMDYLDNVNHAISVVGFCIFDSNYKKELVIGYDLCPVCW